jgi:hypothetical protein
MLSKLKKFFGPGITAAMGLQGISKALPGVSGFITAATAAGYGADAIMGFIREKAEEPAKAQQRQSLEQGAARGTLRPDELQHLKSYRSGDLPQKSLAAASGIAAAMGSLGGVQNMESPQVKQSETADFRQQFPDLDAFISTQIQQGRSPEEAGAIANLNPQFKPAINAISREFGSFSQWVISTYGAAQRSQQQGNSAQSPNQSQSNPSSQALTESLMKGLQAIQALRASR